MQLFQRLLVLTMTNLDDQRLNYTTKVCKRLLFWGHVDMIKSYVRDEHCTILNGKIQARSPGSAGNNHVATSVDFSPFEQELNGSHKVGFLDPVLVKIGLP